jgi:hypothetical protein
MYPSRLLDSAVGMPVFGENGTAASLYPEGFSRFQLPRKVMYMTVAAVLNSWSMGAMCAVKLRTGLTVLARHQASSMEELKLAANC